MVERFDLHCTGMSDPPSEYEEDNGEWVRHSDYEAVEKENKALRSAIIDKDIEIGRSVSKIHNTEEGLKRLDDKMAYGEYNIHNPSGERVVLYNCFMQREELKAPTLSLLVDAILTGGK